MPLRIIGAGLPRTGTRSLQLALEQLGWGPCHHMYELLQDPEQWPIWSRLYQGEPVDWEQAFEGYSAAVDAPAAFLWRQLVSAYPDAKVVLTVRSADSWRQSMLAAGAALRANPPNPSLAPFMQMSVEFFAKVSPAMLPPDDASAFAAFAAHNEAVVREVARDRLLVFDVRHGWEPLCRFLGAAVPDQPFPRTNSAQEFADHARLQSVNAPR